MNIQQISLNPIGTIVKRESDHPQRVYRIGPKLLESLDWGNSWGAYSMRIDDLIADDWSVVYEHN